MKIKPVEQFENITKQDGNNTIITFDINEGEVKTIINEKSIQIVMDSAHFSNIINKFAQEAIKVLDTEIETENLMRSR